jgi:lysophospholipase L1-like esterase
MPSKPFLRKPHVVRVLDVLSGEPSTNPDSPEYGKRFIAEGDSWFSFNAIPHSANMLDQLRFEVDSIVLTLSNPGDTMKHMGEIASNPMLKKYLSEPGFEYDWDAILLSGGGNDLIGAVKDIVVSGTGSDPQNWINNAALQNTLAAVVGGYSNIVAVRSASKTNAQKPVFVHTYDYPTPRNAPAKFLWDKMFGPWFWNKYEALGIKDENLRRAITDHVLDALAQTLLKLPERFERFNVVDTRNTLIRAEPGATGNSNDWLNEIHPNSGGYQKIADKLSAAIVSS